MSSSSLPDNLTPRYAMEGEVLLKQDIGGNSEKTFAVLLDGSDFIVYSAPVKDLEIYRFKSTICWVSTTNVSDKGLFVVNDSHNCCMFFFEAGTQALLEDWLNAFRATGWKISTVVNKELQLKLYHPPIHQQKLDNNNNSNSDNGSRDQSFDLSQLKYASLSLSTSVNFNSLQMTGDNDCYVGDRSTRSLVDVHYSQHLLRGAADPAEELTTPLQQMERSVSLPLLPQSTSPILSVQKGDEDTNLTSDPSYQQSTDVQEDSSNVVVKLRNPKTNNKDVANSAGGVRVRPQSNMYRRSNAAESGYCSKESLLMINDGERSVAGGVGGSLLPSPSTGAASVGANERKPNNNKEFAVAVPYSLKYDPLSSSNASSVFEEKHDSSPQENGIKPAAGNKFFNDHHLHHQSIDRTTSNNSSDGIFDEKSILREATISMYADGGATETVSTPKSEKKASVSQLLSNIKSKFGSTSSRKRVKKNSKSPSETSFSSRLLWKSNGEWLDRWFIYTDGLLAGYKDSSTTKPAEILVDIRSCKLTTLNMRQSNVRNINLFQLTTNEDIAHLFIAWNEDQFKSWLECLTMAAEIKDELYGLTFENATNETSEGVEETDIIPYSASIGTDQRKVTSSSSEASAQSGHHGRVDSIDSGNDGDESGLESSLSSNKRGTEIRRIKSEKDKRMKVPRFGDELSKAKSMSTTKIELSRRISHESSSTENDLLASPGIELNPPLGGSLNIPEYSTTSKKSKRASFIHKKFNFFESKPKKQQHQEEKLSDLKHQQKRQQNSSSRTLSSVAGTPTEDTTATITGASGFSLPTPYSNRPNSLDISSVTMPLSSWEGFTHHGRFKKMSLGSEDEMSDTHSVPGVIEDNKDRIDEALREETLLRKRRNSLNLERSQITNRLEALREEESILANTINNNNHNHSNSNNNNNSKKHLKHHPIENSQDLIVDSEKKKENINFLEQKIHNIDDEIDNIDKQIFNARVLASNDKHWTSTQLRPSSGRSLTRLRLNPKSRAIYDFNSQSVESLSSSVSRESTMSRDTVDSVRSQHHQNSVGHHHNRGHFPKSKSIAISPKTPDSEGGAVAPSPSSQYSGIEELMMTTRRLERSSSNCDDELTANSPSTPPVSASLGTDEIGKGALDCSPLQIWRSKSMGSMELLKSRSMRMDINQNNTSAKTIIEDFEKFSEMLTNQMQEKDDVATV